LVVLAYPFLVKFDLVLVAIDLWGDSLLTEVCYESVLDDVWAAGGLELGTLFENLFVREQMLQWGPQFLQSRWLLTITTSYRFCHEVMPYGLLGSFGCSLSFEILLQYLLPACKFSSNLGW